MNTNVNANKNTIDASAFSSLLDPLIQLCTFAGEQILSIYGSPNYDIRYKGDTSPVTVADNLSHEIIVSGLNELSDLPVLSEEAPDIAWEKRRTWGKYWLVDPLDGTKEFIDGNGEFTVNVALVNGGRVDLGLVYAPVSGVLYYGVRGQGAFKRNDKTEAAVAIHVSKPPPDKLRWKVVSSRSFGSAEFDVFMRRFELPQVERVGSSLKLCLVAEGAADLYPRMGATSEWDTAAAQAIVEAAGGRVISWDTKTDLHYNKGPSLLNPSFVACAEVSPVWAWE